MNRDKVGRRGSAAVEMALMLPFLIYLMFSMVEIGWVIYTKQVVVAAARDAARTLAVHGSWADARQVARQDLSDGRLHPDRASIQAENHGQLVRVVVTYRRRPLLPGLPALVGQPPFKSEIVIEAGSFFRRRG